MKKALGLIPAIVLLLTACGGINIGDEIANVGEQAIEAFHPRTELLNMLAIEEYEKIQQMSNDILNCIKEQDREGLKALFCEQVRNRPGFDDEIDSFIEFCKCHSLNYSIIKETAGGGESIRHGERTEWHIMPEITYLEIVTEADAEDWKYTYYSIYYYWQIIDESDKTREGLHYINIELLNINDLRIGVSPFG